MCRVGSEEQQACFHPAFALFFDLFIYILIRELILLDVDCHIYRTRYGCFCTPTTQLFFHHQFAANDER